MAMMSEHQMLTGDMSTPTAPLPKSTAADHLAECQAAMDVAMSDPEDTAMIDVPKVTRPGTLTA